jgi:hypothetical protein
MNQEQIQSLIIQTICDPRKLWRDRSDAITALKDNAGEPEVKTALLNVLQNDEESYVRYIVAEALAPYVESGVCNGESTPVKAALLNVLRNDTNWHVRSKAAEVLAPHVESGACNGESTPVKDAFVYAFQNDQGYIRCIAAEVLAPHVESGVCNGESTPVKDALLNVLQNDTDWYLRRTAAEVLAPHVDVPPVEEAFCAILNDHDNPPELLKVVADCLKRCPDKPAVQAAFRGVLEDQEWLNKVKAKKKLTRVSAVCKTAVAVLADHAWGVEAVPDLLCNTMQTHPHPPVRLATARALTPRVENNLIVKAAFCDVLLNDNSPPRVCRVAYKALKPHQDEPAVQDACFAALDHMTIALVKKDRALERATRGDR